MLTLIENGELYVPAPSGRQSLLLAYNRIAALGQLDAHKLSSLPIELQVIDATDCIVTPGLIDPHEHLLGGSGEESFQSQTPEIFLSELVTAGITTVVGCLGTDTTTKTMPGLLARAKALRAEGITAFIYSGGYNVPPTTLTGSVRNDLLFIEEVIGAGEVAIADGRATQPTLPELARLVSDAYVGGMLSGKAGVTHFHVGEGEERLKQLQSLLQNYPIKAESLYPTHVERNEALMREAIMLAEQGAFVDVDMMEEDLAHWLRFYLDHNGNPQQLTVSSDAAISSPRTLLEQFQDCILRHGFALEQVLPLFTINTARALHLSQKGKLEKGLDADVLVLRKDTLEVVEVFARGKRMVGGGEMLVTETFLANSNRRITLHGGKQK